MHISFIKTLNMIPIVSYQKLIYRGLGNNNILSNLDVYRLCPLSRSTALLHVSYKYPKTICSSIVNYRQTHEANLDPQRFQCNWETSLYKNPFHNHVVTGNLDIVENIHYSEKV